MHRYHSRAGISILYQGQKKQRGWDRGTTQEASALEYRPTTPWAVVAHGDFACAAANCEDLMIPPVGVGEKKKKKKGEGLHLTSRWYQGTIPAYRL